MAKRGLAEAMRGASICSASGEAGVSYSEFSATPSGK